MARAPTATRATDTAASRIARSPRMRPAVSRSLRAPMYVQVYTTLREWIYEGLYAPGAKLPAESEISAMFGVSRITTRQAIDLLVDERLVLRQQGRGTFVATDLASAPVKGDMDQLLRKGETSKLQWLRSRTVIYAVILVAVGSVMLMPAMLASMVRK